MPPIGDRNATISQVRRSRPASSPQESAPAASGNSSFGSDQVTLSREAQGLTPSISEAQEQAFLKANGGRGGLMPLFQGNKNKPVTLTVHGINDSPQSMKALNDAAARRGETVVTFAYNDQKARLGDSSQDLAKAIAELKAKNPGQPLNISAHSMGGRIAVDALRQLDEANNLKGKTNLQMINPMIGGHSGANYARMAPIGIDAMISGVKPGKDMGTNSGFQKTLETTSLPASVKTQIFVGSNDDLVDKNSPRFQGVADGLNARVTTLQGAGHSDAIDRVARGGK